MGPDAGQQAGPHVPGETAVHQERGLWRAGPHEPLGRVSGREVSSGELPRGLGSGVGRPRGPWALSHVSGQVAAVEGGPHEPGRQVEATDSLGEVPWPGACPPAPRLAPFPEINMPLLYLSGPGIPSRGSGGPGGGSGQEAPSLKPVHPQTPRMPFSCPSLGEPSPRRVPGPSHQEARQSGIHGHSWSPPPRPPPTVSPASGPVPVTRAFHTCQVPSTEAALPALIRAANSVCSRTQQRPPPASPRKRGSSGQLALPPASGLEEGPPGIGQRVGSGRVRLGILGAGLVGHSV